MSNEQVSALIINQTTTQSYNNQPVNCDVVYHENSHKSTSSLYKTYNNQIFLFKRVPKIPADNSASWHLAKCLQILVSSY